MQIRYYYRDGCHLCEEMAAVLHRCWPQQFGQMEWVEVDSDPVYQSAFGHLVPVLEVDGQVLCHYFADVAKIGACFGNSVNPV